MALTFHGFKEVGYLDPNGNYFQVTEKVFVDAKGVKTVTHSQVPDGSKQVTVRPGPNNQWDGLKWVETVTPADVIVPLVITDRQFFQLLALDNLITKEEALAAVKTGDLPEAIDSFISSLEADKQFGARMLFEGASTFDRSHPLVEAFGMSQGMSSAEIDDLWVRASQLK